MDSFKINIKPQYVKQTDEVEMINGNECALHEVQKRIKLDFGKLPEFTIITAPTGTGKSYAFPFPVLNAKKAKQGIGGSARVRGLIVLPTNALIRELTASFTKTYPQIKTRQLTGSELSKEGVKGHGRWKKALEIVEDSDLIITNPDIINFAMHGGYHQLSRTSQTGSTRFSQFMSLLSYIVFDEYHLYDEAQIANILTMVKIREMFLPHFDPAKSTGSSIRFLFVSATPEEGLKQLLQENGYAFEEIIEEIVSDPNESRPIHGELEVEFVDSDDMTRLIEEKLPELKEVLKEQRVLLILDQLRHVQELADYLKGELPEYEIYQSTGYVAEGEPEQEYIKAANLILATNKAEVGVNYDVTYCIMQPGKYFQNFVQRFGRVSRGDLEGKVVMCTDRKYYRLQEKLSESKEWSYYDFLAVMKDELQGRKFYTERVPLYLGEYLWCIKNSIIRYQDYDIYKYMTRKKNELDNYDDVSKARYNLFESIDQKINSLVKESLKLSSVPYNEKGWKAQKLYEKLEQRAPRAWQWVSWWRNYINTYLTFREGGMVVKIHDRVQQKELEYSLDWILQHKIIDDIEVLQEEPYKIIRYTVSNLKERDKDLQYEVSTVPNQGMHENNFLSYKEVFDLKRSFERAAKGVYDKLRRGGTECTQIELAKLVKLLAVTFDRKRLHIVDIKSEDRFI
ncbi:type I-D CRISPR-associated helicase Cas3' [Fulvivirga sediminis]|uniref:Type I-D CRISPR-associated helicase Cas3 n=1 Tax=Fulvivirga sediminis TaxID=2803949 RepID=A0A937F8Q7_9BACT|nr:type I-D CRISPR-associated helicase Cas3' [Fulvivirga sediminis]MBL3656669.1 type I-D CRISPR-associated helicase Cas3' [Fulvivirga sediminis]